MKNRPSRHSLEKVREKLTLNGWTLLSESYENNTQKLQVLCEKGHLTHAVFDKLTHATTPAKCMKCQGKKVWTLENQKEFVRDFGYIIENKEYDYNYKNIIFQCPEGHLYKTSFYNFINGYRYRLCGIKS